MPEIGSIYEGKVTGITNFGAFVEIEPNVTGMVHISEVSTSFVNDINEHLKIGDTVKVKVLAVNDNGKLSLSIKKAVDRPQGEKRFDKKPSGNRPQNQGGRPMNNKPSGQKPRNTAPSSPYQNSEVRAILEDKPQVQDTHFEDMLNKWKQRSDEKMGDIRKNIDGKRRSSSRR